MARVADIPHKLQADAILELRRRAKERDRTEALGAVVVMPDMDPPPVPPEHDLAEEGARAVVEARDNQLAALLADWRKGQR